MKRRIRSGRTACLALALIASSPAFAQPVPFSHPDGTTHWYEVVVVPGGVDWATANGNARGLRGFLATLTSPEETDFVFGLADTPTAWSARPSGEVVGPWLGCLQPDGSPEPSGNWQWTSAEPFTFVNWSAGQPDNGNGSESRLHFGGVSGGRVATWADGDPVDTTPIAYVVEWDWPPDQTVGVFVNDRAASFGGYTIVSSIDGVPPFGATTTDPVSLLDPDGRVVNSWPSPYERGFAPYLLDDGSLLRLVNIDALGWDLGSAGRVERTSWDGNLIWEFDYSLPNAIIHHDIELLPNGNVLMIVWERKTAAEAIAAGRDPALLAGNEFEPDKVIEVQPTFPSGGTIVWEWSVWDHLIQDYDPTKANFGAVANHPELCDVNYPPLGVPGADGPDWMHTNAIDYNAALDQIVLSVRDLNELWIIDHSTTTTEAAGHTGGNSGRGGDILYRWGNPEAYRAGTPADQQVFLAHDVQWIAPGLPGAGNLLLFNNGANRPGGYATLTEITPPVDGNGNYLQVIGTPFGPPAPTWEYVAVNPGDLRSPALSGVQRLPNGNTLYCAGITGNVGEVTPAGETVWRWVSPLTRLGLMEQGEFYGLSANQMFRAYRHAATHPGLAGRDLSPREPLEGYPPEIMARWSAVNLDNGSRTDVLKINGSAGDIWREFHFAFDESVTITLDAAPDGPVPGNYAFYIVPYEATIFDMEVGPFALGVSCIDLPVALGLPATPPTNCVVNTLGFPPLLGLPLVPNTPPAPVTFLQGEIPVGTYTIQGYLRDLGAESGADLSVTNALVIHSY